MTGTAYRTLRSGWVPAVVVMVFTATCLHEVGEVALGDLARFLLWTVWGATVPGTLLWRLLDWRGTAADGRGRPLLEDLVLGTILGTLVSLVPYLLLVPLGGQRAVVLWPLLVLVPALATGAGRAAALRRPSPPAPVWWSWSLALVCLYVATYSAYHYWSQTALTPSSMMRPHIDEPFHLSLIGEFRHHVPAQAPYVLGTPLRYHWLVYPVLAMGSWASGVAPIALLRLLGPVLFSALALLGTAMAARRISGRAWAAPVAAAMLGMLSPLDALGWSPARDPWVPPRFLTYYSPTQMFADALAPLVIVLVVGLLRGAARRPWHWVLTGLVMLAAGGAKAALLPLFTGSLVVTAIVMLVLRRPAAGRTAGVAGLSVVAFLGSTWLFYGPGSRSMTLQPLTLAERMAAKAGLVPADAGVPSSVALVVALVLVVAVLAPALGGVGLLVRGGWRRPTSWALLGFCLTALTVTLLFDHPSASQVYFLYSACVPLAVLGAVGLSRLAGPWDRRTATAVVLAALVGLGAVVLVATATPQPPDTGDGGLPAAVLGLVGPMALLAVVLGLVLLAVARLARRHQPWLRSSALLLLCSSVAGACALMPAAEAASWFGRSPPPQHIWPRVIGPGGIDAARWIERHGTPADVVATNSHTYRPDVSGPAATNFRNFWISAWSERRVLVEGWAYVAPQVVGLPSNDVTNASNGPPFWDPARLRRNDAVFTTPTAAGVRGLRERYGVRWLFVDLRERPDLPGLSRVATEVFSTPRYVVLRIEDDQ